MEAWALGIAIGALAASMFAAGFSWRTARYMLEAEQLSRQSTEGLFKLVMFIGQQTGTLQPTDLNSIPVPPRSEWH